jgi:hypothetical protein
LEKIDWFNPPKWAEEWDQNNLVFDGNEGPRFAPQVRKTDLAALGDLLT